MDVARFLNLIDQKALYFPRVHELQKIDKWEGAVPASHPEPDPAFTRKAARDMIAALAMVSCWHENETESVAMWKLYVSGKEGVAIKTTVASLSELLSCHRELKLGRVLYRHVDNLEHPIISSFGMATTPGRRLARSRASPSVKTRASHMNRRFGR